MNAIFHIGETVPRREDAALLRGEGNFLARRPHHGCAHLAVVRSPLAHATIESIDLGAALAMEGVLLGLVATDLGRNGPMPAADLTDASAPAFQPVLAADRVRYAGEPVAIIVGETPSAARAAAKAVLLRLSPLRPMRSLDEALGQDAVRLRAAHGNAVHELHHRVGEPEAAFDAAQTVLEQRFSFHRVAAAPLEPRGVEAWVDPDTGVLRVAATTQIPGPAREALAALLDRPVEAVAYESLALGGGFGCKEAFYPEEVLVAETARRLGRRVRWSETRSEHFVATSHGRQGDATLRLALSADGTVAALAVDGRSDIGAGYNFASNSPGAAMGAMVRGPYRIPNFTGHTMSVTTNKTPLNVYRGAGHPQAVFAMERMMDAAARTLGIDRIAIRRRNLIADDAFPVDRGVSYPGAGRIVYDSGQYARCLDAALEAIGHAHFAARRRAYEAEHPQLRLGFGLAMLVELTATGPDESISLSVAASGEVTIGTANVEIGQRMISALTQMLSDQLGIAPEAIVVEGGRALAGGGGTYASRGAAVTGAAVADGAAKLKALAIAAVAGRFGVSADTLGWGDGGVTGLPGRNAPLGLAEIAQWQPLSVTGEFRVPASSFASACHAAVLSVDVETGVVEVLDYAVAHDCGRVLNPQGVDDQIMGGVMQGIGATLFEEIAYDDGGLPRTRGYMDYTIPVAANVPRFHLRHIETPSPLNPLGMKGAGEGGFVGVPAALVSGIEDALAEFHLVLTDDGPYTPSRVLGLIAETSHQPPTERSEP
jgi:carbon-monoxide dehydrogenase large subunit